MESYRPGGLIGGDIEAQRAALHSRVRDSGLYLNEIEEFDVAVQAYSQIAGRLGIAEDAGSLTTPSRGTWYVTSAWKMAALLCSR